MNTIIRVMPGGAQIVADHWQVLRDIDAIPLSAIGSHVIVPLPVWRQLKEYDSSKGTPTIGVWIASDDEYEDIADGLTSLPLIAVDFPAFRDGRGYSVAYLLRTRFGYRGELRAIGDVLRDQLFYMHRCGFDSFDVRADKDIQEALLGLTAYTIRYQGSVDDPVPLFRKRAEVSSDIVDDQWEL
ncbi:DUF934 domain-containing protein [Crenobacter sp. SG2305]|uniref:DUF934 domain-containing protein n=1 Tax=Crenobacter oryzisoli TaxID=3056844 RepID=UPI0025AA9D5B|nr:DUF934 domain-containing protein [Crenobacter sp. SG2305]MDN0085269.1 DUF934 domain-containing protein [Crenobacter sp. SG2305]